MRDADLEETAPSSPTPVITRLSCSLAGIVQEVALAPNTLSFLAYGKERITEQFACSYGLNEGYRAHIAQRDLIIAGEDANGDARIVELSSHRFFIATLFLPQLSSKPGNPHPLISAFLKAAMTFQSRKNDERAAWLAVT